MRLRAQITVDFEAADFVEAAAHQKVIQRHLEQIQADYPNANLAIRERRERRPEKAMADD
jgi:hypothetical protein